MIKVLHVDENEYDLELTKLFLTRLSSEIELRGARSAAEGLKELERDKFDCILVDYLMPGMDGLDMLERIRNNNGSIPFILYTGESGEELAARARELGADDYVEKGVTTDHYELLLEKIIEVVEANRRRQMRKQPARAN